MLDTVTPVPRFSRRSEAMVRISALNAWVNAFEPHSANAGEPFHGWPSIEDDVPLATFVDLAEQISARADNPWLGWSVGLNFDLIGLGEISQAIAASRSLRGALQRIVDYFGILQDACEVRLDIAGKDASISYRILDPDIWPRRQDALFTLGIFAKIIRGAVGAAWSEAEVVLEADENAAKADSGKVLGARCAFDGDTNLIRFPASMLDLPLGMRGESPLPNHARLTREVAMRRRRMPATLRVRTMIFQGLTEGEFTQDSVARSLGMSSRTLRRRLSDEGVSFQHLLDECRMRLAAFEFRVRDNVSIAQTALRLGYSEHSTFTRAFSRWSGMPPQRYIRAAREALR